MQSVVEIKFSSNDTRNVQKQRFQVSSVFRNPSAEKCSEPSGGHITVEIILIFIPHRLSINLELMVRVENSLETKIILHSACLWSLGIMFYYEKSPKYAKVGYYNESPILIAQIQSFLASCHICFIYTLLPSF